MRAAIDEEGRQVVTERGGSVVDGGLGEREMTVRVVHAAVGVGAQCVADVAVNSPGYLGEGWG